MPDQKSKVALSDIKKLLRTNGIEPFTHLRKGGKITLNISVGDAKTGIQKIIDGFGISATSSPRGTSIVLNESEVSVEERNPRQKNESVSKKQYPDFTDALTQLHLAGEGLKVNARAELEKKFYLIPKDKEEVLIPLAEFVDKIKDGNIPIPVSSILKALQQK